MAQMESRLWCKTDVGGVARYENDYYYQISHEVDKVPGNPWMICTLWLALWYLARAKTAADFRKRLRENSRVRRRIVWNRAAWPSRSIRTAARRSPFRR